jgi:hypothetical protein
MEESLNEIQTVINQLLNVKSLVRRKKKTQEAKKRELFISIINSIEAIINRQDLMYAELNLDLANYDEAFLDTIDALIILHFGKEGAEVIAYYLWDRVAPDGSITPLLDTENREVYLETANDLWNLLISINPAYGDAK